MSDPVVIPSAQRSARRQGVFIPPLLIIPLLVYNLLAFIFPMNWGNSLVSIGMMSGVPWSLTAGDLIISLSLVVLFLEIVKSTQSGRSSVLEHMLSTLVFILFLVEFLLVAQAATSVFFILMVMALFDVIAGFTVSITSAGRDVTMSPH